MRIAIVGSRTFDDYRVLAGFMDAYCGPFGMTEIVSGGARGADSLAEQYAKEKGLAMKVFLPDWNRHGKSAGFIRNSEIVEYADKVVAFWDGKSNGTRDTIKKANDVGKLYKVVDVRALPTKEGDKK